MVLFRIWIQKGNQISFTKSSICQCLSAFCFASTSAMTLVTASRASHERVTKVPAFEPNVDLPSECIRFHDERIYA